MQNHSPQQHRPLSTATLQHPGQIRDVRALMQHLHNSGGKFAPIWVHHSAMPHVAKLIQSGHAIPHPGVPIPMPDPQQQQQPQGYAQGGVIMPPNPIQNDFGPGQGQPPIANHPAPQFLGPPVPAPQQIDNGAIGMQNPPTGLSGLNVGGNQSSFLTGTPGLANVSIPTGGAINPVYNPVGTNGGANPVQNDFGGNGAIEPDVPALNKSINPRMMKKGGVVKKSKGKK